MRKGVKEAKKTINKALKIRCRYCDIRNTCKHREKKENYENAGWMTYCALTPNKPSKKKRRK